MRYTKLSLCLIIPVLTGLLIGCGNENVKVHGKVVFSDDNSPLTVGTICFESGNTVSRGKIKEDGSFSVYSVKENDGIPPGTYKVYFLNAVKGEGNPLTPKIVYQVHSKYQKAATSDITLTIDKSTKSPLEIKVDPYEKKIKEPPKVPLGNRN